MNTYYEIFQFFLGSFFSKLNITLNFFFFFFFCFYCNSLKVIQYVDFFQNIQISISLFLTFTLSSLKTKMKSLAKSRHSFSKEEDESLIKLVARYGEKGKWNQISKLIPNRDSRQCRDRWHHYLSPLNNSDEWTDAEDQKLLTLYFQHGRKWAAFKLYFPGRTAVNIKSRWYKLNRKLQKSSHIDIEPIQNIIRDDSANSLSNSIQRIGPKVSPLINSSNINKTLSNLSNHYEQTNNNQYHQTDAVTNHISTSFEACQKSYRDQQSGLIHNLQLLLKEPSSKALNQSSNDSSNKTPNDRSEIITEDTDDELIRQIFDKIFIEDAYLDIFGDSNVHV
ncbi:hypothetical protein TRFO_22139 [Tritrichomonas foetus]|uniref:Myb-like DNA-binding domain containing protein n=1 Tax=Tritrichomonas foetus TaxID=1144522 RepID=A0A1J4KCH7_9EUKA|nr:hypothetical protein TRFO_22139 [Tritrichomonas foetus]|eukprot:OHT09127.1 hypothetical protein TRFO_22139 [Tritrichomonas foetus]